MFSKLMSVNRTVGEVLPANTQLAMGLVIMGCLSFQFVIIKTSFKYLIKLAMH